MRIKRKLKKNYNFLETYVNWKRPVTDKNPRAYAREAIYDSIKGIEIATKKYNNFQKLLDAGLQVRRTCFEFDGKEYAVSLFYDLTANVLGEKYKDKIHPKGYIELPDDFGYAILADFYDSVQRNEFEFGDSYKDPEKWLQEFTKKLITSEEQDITDEYKKDLEDNLLNTFIVPAGATGKDFTKFLFNLQKYDKNIYTTLKQVYASRFGSESLENGLVEPLWNTLEDKVSEIIKEERQRNGAVDKESIRDKLYSFTKQFSDIDFTATKTTLASLLMLSAAAAGFFAKDKPDHTSADTPDKDTNSRQDGYEVTKIIESENGFSAPAIYEDKIVWIEKDGIVINDGHTTTRLFSINASEFYSSTIDIYDDYVVWNNDGNIYFGSISEAEKSFIGKGVNPSIYGDNIVYTYPYEGSLMLYDIKTSEEKVLLNESSNKKCSEPRIWENDIIFIEYDMETMKDRVALYNLTTKDYKYITSLTGRSPDIYKNEQVWEDPTVTIDENDKIIYAHNTFVSNSFDGINPHVFANRIIYQKEMEEDIYSYDILTKEHTQLTSGKSIDTLDIWENKIVWETWQENKDCLYLLKIPKFSLSNIQEGDDIIHLTDTHVWRNSNRVYDFVSYVNALNKKPKVILISGDVVDWGAGESGSENFRIFFQSINKLDSDIDLYLVPGNHDCRYGLISTSIPIPLEGDKFENYYSLVPAKNDLTTGVADLGDVVVIGLNSGRDELNSFTSPFPPEGSGLSNTQISSLEEKLDALDGVENGVDNSGKEKIIMMHHPTFWKNEDGADDGVFLHNRNEFRELCKQYGVDVVLAGHTHESDIKEVAGTKYVVTAAGGENAAFRKITYTKSGLEVKDTEFFKETITGTVDCPATISMYDVSENEVSKEKQELPGAFYSGWELSGDRTETVSAYKGGHHHFVVTGTNLGQFKFLMKENEKTIFKTEPLLIMKDVKYEFTPVNKKVYVREDKDKDGIYENSVIVTDGELTAKELKQSKDSTEEIDNIIYYIAGGLVAVGGAGGLGYWYFRRREKSEPLVDKIESYSDEIDEDEEIIDLRGLLGDDKEIISPRIRLEEE
ncbi:hypothetical protein GF374_02250 [Candidatus Woesearchaeota archaeon]|nr:hypothetical protein [Candidatus Woesearchaeota archaeon]